MSAAVFAMLCRAGRCVLFARQNEAVSMERFANGESDWKLSVQRANGDWLQAAEALLIALNDGGRA